MKKYAVLIALFVLFLASGGLADISITSFLIAGGNPYTSSQKPTLSIDVNGTATHMKFSCNGSSYPADSIPYAQTHSDFNIVSGLYGCSAGDGNKTVYVKVYQGMDTNESAPALNSITLDTTAPSNSITSHSNGATTESRTVSFTANDSASGINAGTIRVDINGTPSTSFNPSTCTVSGGNYSCSYTENRFDTNNTDYNISVFSTDNVGNASAPAIIVFHYMDTSAPAQITGLAATAGNGQVALSWTASSAHDLASYLVYRGTVSGFDTNSFSLIATVASGTTTYPATGLSNGTTYYFKVSAKDKSGLEGSDSDEKSATPSETTSTISTPTITSSTHTHDVWSSNNDPVFSWATVSGATSYKCVLDQNSGTLPSANCSSPFNQDGTQEGAWYFHLRACDSSNTCSSTAHFKAKIDRTGPNQPQDFSVESNPDGTISLNWAGSTDSPSGENSGIKEYVVYRHHDDDFDATEARKISVTTSTSYSDNDSDLLDGTRYYYKVRAVDNQNNLGTLSAERSVIFQGESQCSNSFSFNFSNFIGGENFTLILNSTSAMTAPQLKLRVITVGFIEPGSIDTKSTSITAVYPLSETLDGKSAEITINSTDSSGEGCFEVKTATIDRQKPSVEFSGIEEGQELALDEKITILAGDEGSGVKEVKVFAKLGSGDFQEIGTATKTAQAQFELSPEELEGIVPGETGLKAVATDNAGNQGEIIINVKAKSGANVLGEEEFVFSGNLKNALKEKGFSEELASRASSLTIESDSARIIEVLKKGDKFTVRITILIVNNSGAAKSFKVLEFIPKSLVESALGISSAHNFNVLQQDPVIEFVSATLQAGSNVSFSYELKDQLSESEARELVEKGIAKDFELPAIALGPEEDTSKIFSQIEQQDLGFFSIIVIGILVVVVLIIVFGLAGGAAILHLHKKKNLSEMERKFYENEGSLMQKASKKLSQWLQKKEEEKPKTKKFGFGRN